MHFQANLIAEGASWQKKLGKDDVGRVEFVQADIDRNAEGRRLTDPDEKAALVAQLTAGEFGPGSPSFIIDSGNGVQALWRLTDPVDPKAGLDEVEGYGRTLADRNGWDHCFASNHLFRLPGTINYPNAAKRAENLDVVAVPPARHINAGCSYESWEFDLDPQRHAATEKVSIGGPVVFETMDELLTAHPAASDLREVIELGYDPQQPDRFPGAPGNDGWEWQAVKELLRAGLSPEEVFGVLLHPDWVIGRRTREHKGRPDEEAHALWTIERAVNAVRQDVADDLAALGDLEPEHLVDPSRPHRFKRYSLLDLANLPDPIWITEGLILERSLAMIYGPPKSFKTFLAIDLALCLATGRPFHGMVVKRSRVTYIAAEGHPAETRDRALCWCQDNAVDPADLAGWFALVFSGVQLDQPASVDEFLKLDASPCDVFFFDTLNRNMDGDESGTQDMTKVVSGADRIRRERKAAGIIIHHTGVNQDRERGSTVLRGAADTRLKVTQKSGVVTMKVEDQRAEPSGQQMHFTPVNVIIGEFESGRSSVVLREASPADKGHQDQGPKRSADDVMLVRIYQRKPARYIDLADAEAEGLSKPNVYKVRDRLVAAGYVLSGDEPRLTTAGTARAKVLVAEGE